MGDIEEAREILSRLSSILTSALSSYSEEGKLLKEGIDNLRLFGKPEDLKLKKAEKRIDEIVDELIVLSQKAWKEYGQAEALLSSEHAEELQSARELCQKAEDLMTSLLCYSLSYFRDRS